MSSLRAASVSLLQETSTSGGDYVGSMASEIQGNPFFGSRMTALSFSKRRSLSGWHTNRKMLCALLL